MKIEGACHPVISVCPFNKELKYEHKLILMQKVQLKC